MKNEKNIVIIFYILLFIELFAACLCLYYLTRTAEPAEREIGNAQELNLEATIRVGKIASSTDAIAKRLQTGIKRIAKAKKRIESVTRNASEAIAIIEECESILKEIETQE